MSIINSKNMKLKILILLSIISLLVSTSCSEDGVTKKTITETPFSTYSLSKPTLNFETYTGIYNLGYEFTVLSNGSVTALGVAAPHAGTFTVQLYYVDVELNSGALLAETQVTLTETDVEDINFIYADLINAIELEVGATYRVAYTEPEEKLFYRLQEQDGHALPIAMENSVIQVTQGVYGLANSFPDESWNVLYTADVKISHK
jgi:hypothetical protein